LNSIKAKTIEISIKKIQATYNAAHGYFAIDAKHELNALHVQQLPSSCDSLQHVLHWAQLQQLHYVILLP
jgi:hypothetical protein